jgi:MBG domain (YGX type)/Bacterial Ig domain
MPFTIPSLSGNTPVVRIVLVTGRNATWEYVACICLASVCLELSALALSVSNYSVQVSATVQTNPPQITLSWPADSLATGYDLYRKTRDATDWGSSSGLAANATNYVDSNVVVGGAYEYRIVKHASSFVGVGYIYAGIEAPLVESRGTLVLVVDNSQSSSLTTELARLQQDLVGDGWTVLRHDVPRMAVDPASTSSSVWAARSNELASVKALIQADFNANPASVSALLLFGHVPVPYAGDLAPDAHFYHTGAWPADVYYGDMNGVWTDSSTSDTNASDTRNWNLPGDGKFDQTTLPSDVELQVGRVDFANLPTFPQSETALLRQYLNKDHNFRHKVFAAQRRGLIDDNFGLSAGTPFAMNGWGNFAAFFGASNISTGGWLSTLGAQSYLWGYGCGPGTYTSASGVASTSDFVTVDTQVIFTMLYGSYFGDWDSQNDFLRAQLATATYTLASAWAGQPNWFFHHMALGEPIGFSARLTQNNNGITYLANGYSRYVHIALMGDPTLRMHIVAPPTNLVAVANGSGGVDLSWNASLDTVLGYHVYRAPTAAGPFTRLTTNLVGGTGYTDPAVTTNVYMVRAVKLEVSGSGSYYNASQGIFQSFTPVVLPVLTITAQNTNKIYGAPLPTFTPLYSGFTNGDTPASLTAQPVLSTSATPASPVGTYPIHASGAVSSNYAIQYVDGTLAILPAATTELVTSTANPSLPGQPVSFTLTLGAVTPGAGTPTGTAQFRIDGTNVIGPLALSGGVAGYSMTNLSHGLHVVGAEYAGDGNFIGTTNVLSPAQLINTPPVAGPVTVQRDPATGVKVSVATLLSNATDADGDPLAFTGESATSANGGIVASNAGWIFYTPASGFTNTDTFTYMISDGWAAPVTGVVTVNIRTNTGPSPNLTITDLGGGSYAILGDGIPDRTYRIQFSDEPQGTNWQTLGTAPADPYGIFQFSDTNGSPQRFYRSVYP